MNIFKHNIFLYTIYINNLNGRVRPTPDLPPDRQAVLAHRTSESSSLWSRLSTAGSAVGATLNE